MSTQAEALESKRKYVQSLTRSAILQDLLLDEYDFPEDRDKHTNEPSTDKQIPVHLHFLFVLPATTDSAVYDQIFESIKRHFPQVSHDNTRCKQKRSRISTTSYY